MNRWPMIIKVVMCVLLLTLLVAINMRAYNDAMLIDIQQQKIIKQQRMIIKQQRKIIIGISNRLQHIQLLALVGESDRIHNKLTSVYDRIIVALRQTVAKYKALCN